MFAQEVLNPIDTAWIALVVGILIGTAGTIAVFFGGLKRVIQAKMERWERDIREGRQMGRQSHLIAVELMAQSYDLIESLIRMEDCVDRILLMTGQNGGGVPTHDKPYNVTCLFARCIDPHKNPAQLYAGPLRVDSAYMKMMRDVIRYGVVTVTHESMTDCMLKGFYTSEGVVQARIYFLSLTPERLTYCSVASYKRVFTISEVARIDAAVARLRGIMDTDPILQTNIQGDSTLTMNK